MDKSKANLPHFKLFFVDKMIGKSHEALFLSLFCYYINLPMNQPLISLWTNYLSTGLPLAL